MLYSLNLFGERWAPAWWPQRAPEMHVQIEKIVLARTHYGPTVLLQKISESFNTALWIFELVSSDTVHIKLDCAHC